MNMPASKSDDRTCDVAVFHRANQPLAICRQSIPPLRDGEVLVRVTCCTICGSDLHTYSGKRDGPTPSILGHEIIGIVEEICGAVADIQGAALSLGDRITWSVAASCHACNRCCAGMPQKCDSLFKYGHEPLTESDAPNGGLAEKCLLQKGTSIVQLPNGVSDAILCPANCATATVAAAVRTAGPLNGRRVLIFGAGMLGLTAAAMAATYDASEVFLCDIDVERADRALRFGATGVGSKPREGDFDAIFEMSGSSAAVEAAFESAAIGGTVVLVGSVFPSPSVSVDPEQIVRRLLSIHGVHNYRPEDLVAAVTFLADHHQRFEFAALVERQFSLSESDAAIGYAIEKRPIRVSVVPNACAL